MGLFGASPADTEVENATSEQNESEKWDAIMDICDKAGKSSEDAKNYLKAILKRLNHTDPHVAIQAVTLLDACVNNSGKTFHIEIASRDFENEYTKLLSKCHPKVGQKLRESLKKWAEGEFKNDQQLNLIPSLYAKLKNKGLDFSSLETPPKKTISLSKDPNVVQSQEEEDQIVKAIELSLKETSGSPRASSGSSSLYPSMNLGTASLSASTTPAKEPRKVRALYDFEAAEENELTFNSGEIIFVLDDSDANWWKGSNQRGEGLFPANFVTADLSVEPEQFLYEKAKKSVQFKESAEAKQDPEDVEINETKIDRLLHLLHEADPTNPDRDTDEMLTLEREVNLMGPLIDAELERVDRKHAQLTQLSSDLVDAVGLYHMLMHEPQFPSVTKVPFGYPHGSQPSPSVVYSGAVPPNAGLPSMMPPNFPNSGVPNPERPFVPHQGGPQGLPPQFTLPGQMPGVMPHQQVHPMPPVSTQQHAMPPSQMGPPQSGLLQQQSERMLQQQSERRLQQDPSMPQYPSGAPHFSLPSIPINFQHQHDGPISLQSGPPSQHSGHFVPASNMHLM